MKKNSLLIGMIFLLNACTSNQKTFIEELTILKEINDNVSFENKCKLTVDYSDEKPHEIKVTIRNSYNDLLLPGKVLFDFNERILKTDLRIDDYHLNDVSGEVYNLSKLDLAQIKHKAKLSNSLLENFKNNDLTKCYDQLDTSVSNKVNFEDFKRQIRGFQLNHAKFSGFQAADTLLGIGYKSSANQIVFFYRRVSDDDKIYGYSLE